MRELEKSNMLLETFLFISVLIFGVIIFLVISTKSKYVTNTSIKYNDVLESLEEMYPDYTIRIQKGVTKEIDKENRIEYIRCWIKIAGEEIEFTTKIEPDSAINKSKTWMLSTDLAQIYMLETYEALKNDKERESKFDLNKETWSYAVSAPNFYELDRRNKIYYDSNKGVYYEAEKAYKIYPRDEYYKIIVETLGKTWKLGK